MIDMQYRNQISEKIKKIENLLVEAFEDLSNLTEENFDQKFQLAISKMEIVRKVKLENQSKFTNFDVPKKNIQMAKLISDKYDNVVKDWADKLKTVQKEIELTQNQKKITIYNR